MLAKFLLTPLLWLLTREQVVAWLLSHLLAKIDGKPGRVDAAIKTADRIAESATLTATTLRRTAGYIHTVAGTLDDGKLSKDEIAKLTEATLKAWSHARKTPEKYREIWIKK